MLGFFQRANIFYSSFFKALEGRDLSKASLGSNYVNGSDANQTIFRYGCYDLIRLSNSKFVDDTLESV
jgi:hypothetical protein